MDFSSEGKSLGSILERFHDGTLQQGDAGASKLMVPI
jgi:hypothetical protein